MRTDDPMPTMHLTDAAIKRLKPPVDATRVEYWDSNTPGAFGLRVSKTGIKTWVLIVRALRGGRWVQQRVTLGRYPAVSLAEARAKAAEARTLAEQGKDPASLVKADRQDQMTASRNTFGVVFEEFMGKYRGQKKRRPAKSTMAELKRAVTADVLPAWKDRPMVQITRRDVLDVLDPIVARGSEYMANRVLAYLKIVFGWATGREIIETDPTAGMKRPTAEVSRERVLSLDETLAVWRRTDPASMFGGIVRLLLLTGQRLSEVTGMRWSELDGNTWSLPGTRTKNGLPNIVPLSAPALEVIEARRMEQASMRLRTDFVFTVTGRAPYTGAHHSKRRLDAAIGIAPWHLHDLRRTFTTHAAEAIRTPPHVIEAVLNHVSGAKAGVAGTYNRALYLDERRAALDAWAGYLLRQAGDRETANVIEFRTAGNG